MDKKTEPLLGYTIPNIHKTKPMWFNEPRVRGRVERCLPTVTIRTRPTDEFRHVVHGSRFNRHETGVIVSTKTLYDFIGLDENVLLEHLSESGFNSTKEWSDAIKRQHKLEKPGLSVPEEIKLYVVRVTPICKRSIK